jgi:hypothetical protein
VLPEFVASALLYAFFEVCANGVCVWNDDASVPVSLDAEGLVPELLVDGEEGAE